MHVGSPNSWYSISEKSFIIMIRFCVRLLVIRCIVHGTSKTSPPLATVDQPTSQEEISKFYIVECVFKSIPLIMKVHHKCQCALSTTYFITTKINTISHLFLSSVPWILLLNSKFSSQFWFLDLAINKYFRHILTFT